MTKTIQQLKDLKSYCNAQIPEGPGWDMDVDALEEAIKTLENIAENPKTISRIQVELDAEGITAKAQNKIIRGFLDSFYEVNPLLKDHQTARRQYGILKHLEQSGQTIEEMVSKYGQYKKGSRANDEWNRYEQRKDRTITRRLEYISEEICVNYCKWQEISSGDDLGDKCVDCILNAI